MPVAIAPLRPELAAVIGAAGFPKNKPTANLQRRQILSLFDTGTVEGTGFCVHKQDFTLDKAPTKLQTRIACTAALSRRSTRACIHPRILSAMQSCRDDQRFSATSSRTRRLMLCQPKLVSCSLSKRNEWNNNESTSTSSRKRSLQSGRDVRIGDGRDVRQFLSQCVGRSSGKDAYAGNGEQR
jgi:hypothetical protein